MVYSSSDNFIKDKYPKKRKNKKNNDKAGLNEDNDNLSDNYIKYSKKGNKIKSKGKKKRIEKEIEIIMIIKKKEKSLHQDLIQILK
jgi:hypothetical protein